MGHNLLERFELFIASQGLKVSRSRNIKFGDQLTLADAHTVVHCTIYHNGTILIQGQEGSLKELLNAWADNSSVDTDSEYELGYQLFPESWREWRHDAYWLADYIIAKGLPEESEAPEEYKIHREITFHDYMFRHALADVTVTRETIAFVLRNWLDRFCFMGLEVEQIIQEVFSSQYAHWNENTDTTDIGSAANAISENMCNHCSRRFVKIDDQYMCPQVRDFHFDCTAQIVDALFAFSASKVVAYTKSNLNALLKGGKNVVWYDTSPSGPLEITMAQALKDSGILFVPQYQAHDDIHKYKIDFLIKTSRGPLIAIECDGLQFHATKSTYIKDRIRDRYLQHRGFYVMRFSSIEIFNDINACVNEIDETFWRLQRGKLTLQDRPRTSYFGMLDEV